MAEFHDIYGAMSDSELLRLAGERDDLVEDARVALDSELRRRSLIAERTSMGEEIIGEPQPAPAPSVRTVVRRVLGLLAISLVVIIGAKTVLLNDGSSAGEQNLGTLGDRHLLEIIFSVLLNWAIGLAPALLIRLFVAGQPLSRRAALLTAGAIYAVLLVLGTAVARVAQVPQNIGALSVMTLASYWLLRARSEENRVIRGPLAARTSASADASAAGPQMGDASPTHRPMTQREVLLLASGAVVAGGVVIAAALVGGGFLVLPIATDSNATTRLIEALERDDWPAASNAIRAGANAQIALGGRSLLTHAVRKGELEEVQFLIENGADINAQTTFGRSALHEAALYGYPEIARVLLEHGADVNARNPRGETPLFYAEVGLILGPRRTEAHARVAAVLREHGGVK